MVTVKIRRVDDATVMSLPQEILEKLDVRDGTMIDLYVGKGILTARPIRKDKQNGSLAERFHGVDLEGIAVLSVN